METAIQYSMDLWVQHFENHFAQSFKLLFIQSSKHSCWKSK